MLLLKAVRVVAKTHYLFSNQFLVAAPQGMSAIMVLLTDLHGPVTNNSLLMDT